MKYLTTKIAFLATVIGVVVVFALVKLQPSNTPKDGVPLQNTMRKEQKIASPISPAVLVVLNQSALPYQERADALGLIRNDLPLSDRLALLASLSGPVLPGLSHDDWFCLANDIIVCLRFQQPAMPEITPALLSIWRDRNAMPTMRDYALQHLRLWVHDLDHRTAQETDLSKIKEIQEAFFTAVDAGQPYYDPSSTTVGTALLALDDWCDPKHPHPLKDSDFHQRLLEIIGDEAVHRGTRATALQIASKRNLSAALPFARSIMNPQTQNDTILRLAAINFLGCNGNDPDKQLLLSFQQQHPHESLLQSALAKSIDTLTQK